MWKKACAFSKWIPTNQFLHDVHTKKIKVNWKEKDLSRFGFVGDKKECYWGLIAVLWQKPLPVAQEIGNMKNVKGDYSHYGKYTGYGSV